MEGKKIPDEELLRLLEIFAKDDEPNGVRLLAAGALDFIHRLQDEIERLTEERDMYADDLYWKAEVRKREDFINELTVETAELQKQVDELTDKLGKVLSGIKADEFLVARGVEQAVIDTAKEIFSRLAKRRHQGFDGGGFFVEYTLRLEDLNWFEECYGVEVE